VRIAVLSDIHSNLEALDAVLTRARSERADATYVLGDIVGYGADPNEVIARLMQLPSGVMIAGNHDLAATGRFETAWFNPVAAEAIEWTVEVMTKESSRALEELEPRAGFGENILVHGSVVDPAAEYVLNVDAARASFDADAFERCFFGHTHLPTLFERDERNRVTGRPLRDGEVVSLGDGGNRFMANPGSVGQPRDGDPRASMMLYDTSDQSAVVYRVEYPIEQAARKIRDAGLPAILADRLSRGQ
jgi:predicted phosphodiesterase